jgi:hypothetical protein
MAADGQPVRGVAPHAGLLAGVRRSLEGERAAVEPAHSSALSQDPGAQPYVVAGEWRRRP